MGGLADRILWVVIIGGALSALIFVLVKVFEVVVKRRTAALLEKHGGEGGEQDGPPSPES